MIASMLSVPNVVFVTAVHVMVPVPPPLPPALIVMVKFFVSLPLALVALTTKEVVPVAVGVQEIVPEEESDKPFGNVPLSLLHVMGVSPVAVNVWLYAVFTVPLGNDVVVIVMAVSPPPES